MRADAQLYHHGDIYTVDDALPVADAVAVRKGRILAVGTESHCRAALGDTYTDVDLEGRTLLPGFIDTHMHPVPLIFFEMNVDLRDVSTMAQVQSQLRDAAEEKSEGEWVVGLQFDEQFLDEPRIPTRHDLDAACPERPAIVIKHDGHTVIGNTRAIEAAGVSAATADPEGGVIDRETDGTPEGAFRENAARILLSAMPLPEMDALTAGAADTFHHLARLGITSVGAILQTDAEGPAGSQGAYDVALMQMMLEHVPVNLYGILIAADTKPFEAAQASPLHREEIGAGHRIGAIKIYADGTFGSCTACMRTPFTDQPDRRGFMTLSEAEIYWRMVAAHTAGLQVAVHAIGDQANRRCIDLYRQLLQEYPRKDPRHRLEHASLLDAEMIADCAELGIVISTQPMFIHSEKTWLHKRIGEARAQYVYPLRDLFRAGVCVAGASDAPVESADVLHAMECCVTREGFESQQGITPHQAIRMYTIDAAYAQFEESVKGSISPGKRADFVVLDANPVHVAPDKIHAIRVERTIVGGAVVYDRAAA